MLAKPRVILFDWGGTLVGVTRQFATFSQSAAAAVYALRGAGITVSAASADNLRRRFADCLARNDSVDNLREFDSVAFLRGWATDETVVLPRELDDVIDALWRPWIGCLDVLGDVPGALQRLRDLGITLGLVSNCATVPHICRAELARQHIGELLAFSLFSSELEVRKPDPRIYEAALARSRAACNGSAADLQPGEVLFVGDTPMADVDGPARIGMRTVLVRTGRWNGDHAALRRQPDRIIDSIHGLPSLWT